MKVEKVANGFRMSLPSILMLLIVLGLCLSWGAMPLEAAADRFFMMGDGRLAIENMHNGSYADVSILNADGSLNEAGLRKIDEVFGFPTSEKGEHISPRLLFMLDYFTDIAGAGKRIHMISGYRSPEYNNKLRDKGANAARTSQHLDGMALDFYLDGVDGKELWELIRSRDCCGVGHYGGKSIHLDSGKPRFWEAATSKVRTTESEQNRRIYLTTDYDRYRIGDPLRLSFSSVSDFGFGVKPTVTFLADSGEDKTMGEARLETAAEADCSMVNDRRAARFMNLTVPAQLRPGRYRIKVEFCRSPFPTMPGSVVSNTVEILRQGA